MALSEALTRKRETQSVLDMVLGRRSWDVTMQVFPRNVQEAKGIPASQLMDESN